MAKEDKLMKKSAEESKDHNYKLHFIKDCECGVLINEHLLPNAIEDSNLTRLFTSCVEWLINANIRYESNKFATILIRAVGNYMEIEIENRNQLRELLDKLCEACGICPNFINEKEIKECSFCDIEKEEEEPQKKRFLVIFVKVKSMAPENRSGFVFNNKVPRVTLTRMDFSNQMLQSSTDFSGNFDSINSIASISANANAINTSSVLETAPASSTHRQEKFAKNTSLMRKPTEDACSTHTSHKDRNLAFVFSDSPTNSRDSLNSFDEMIAAFRTPPSSPSQGALDKVTRSPAEKSSPTIFPLYKL